MLLIIKYQMAYYDRTITGRVTQTEIKRRFSNIKQNIEPKLFSDTFDSNSYNKQGDFYTTLTNCETILQQVGYIIDLADNTIYLHFIYVGKRVPDDIVNKISRVHSHFKRHLSGCNLLTEQQDNSRKTLRYEIKTILWYDKYAPDINMGQNIEARKIDELINNAIDAGYSSYVANSLWGFAQAKSTVNQGAIAADILRFMALYAFGGFYTQLGKFLIIT